MRLNKDGSIIKRQTLASEYESDMWDWYHVSDMPDFDLMRECVKLIAHQIYGDANVPIDELEGCMYDLCDELGLEKPKSTLRKAVNE
jgi:hypothetical protein